MSLKTFTVYLSTCLPLFGAQAHMHKEQLFCFSSCAKSVALGADNRSATMHISALLLHVLLYCTP